MVTNYGEWGLQNRRGGGASEVLPPFFPFFFCWGGGGGGWRTSFSHPQEAGATTRFEVVLTQELDSHTDGGGGGGTNSFGPVIFPFCSLKQYWI